MKCFDCQFYIQTIDGPYGTQNEIYKRSYGKCHRYPPNFQKEFGIGAGFPTMSENDWCGEFKMDQLAIERKFLESQYQEMIKK